MLQLTSILSVFIKKRKRSIQVVRVLMIPFLFKYEKLGQLIDVFFFVPINFFILLYAFTPRWRNENYLKKVGQKFVSLNLVALKIKTNLLI